MNETPQLARFTHTLERQEPQFRVALPKNIDPRRYIRILRTAVNSRPELLLAAVGAPQEQNSFWVAVMKAAQSGLAPDGREGFINVYNTNVAKKGEKPVWVRKCEWQPMIYGIYKLLRQNPAVHSPYAHVVREKDAFMYQLGDTPSIEHAPAVDAPDAPVTFAYAIIKMANGDVEREVMSRAQIEKARSKSKAPDSLMWTDFYDQACCKVVMKRLAKRIPAIDEEIFGEEEEQNKKADEKQAPSATLTPTRAIRSITVGQEKVDVELEPLLPEDEPEPLEETEAFLRGKAECLDGMERKAVPPEYRGEGKTDLAAKWLEGWEDAAKEKKEPEQ